MTVPMHRASQDFRRSPWVYSYYDLYYPTHPTTFQALLSISREHFQTISTQLDRQTPLGRAERQRILNILQRVCPATVIYVPWEATDKDSGLWDYCYPYGEGREFELHPADWPSVVYYPALPGNFYTSTEQANPYQLSTVLFSGSPDYLYLAEDPTFVGTLDRDSQGQIRHSGEISQAWKQRLERFAPPDSPMFQWWLRVAYADAIRNSHDPNTNQRTSRFFFTVPRMRNMVDSLIQRILTTGFYHDFDISNIAAVDYWIRQVFLEPYLTAGILQEDEIINIYLHAERTLVVLWKRAILENLNIPMLPWDLVVRELPLTIPIAGDLMANNHTDAYPYIPYARRPPPNHYYPCAPEIDWDEVFRQNQLPQEPRPTVCRHRRDEWDDAMWLQALEHRSNSHV